MNLVQNYLPVFLIMLVAFTLAGLFFLGATYLFSGAKPKATAGKLAPYECGSESTGGKHVKLSVKFYLTAILFVVFDIEAIFFYPWATQFKTLGWYGLTSMFAFVAVVFVALVYCWKKGALEWES